MTKNNHISVTVKLFATLKKFGEAKSVVTLPEGSTVKSILEKWNIPKDEKTLIIMVNGRGRESDFVLENGDVVALFPPIGGG